MSQELVSHTWQLLTKKMRISSRCNEKPHSRRDQWDKSLIFLTVRFSLLRTIGSSRSVFIALQGQCFPYITREWLRNQLFKALGINLPTILIITIQPIIWQSIIGSNVIRMRCKSPPKRANYLSLMLSVKWKLTASSLPNKAWLILECMASLHMALIKNI